MSKFEYSKEVPKIDFNNNTLLDKAINACIKTDTQSKQKLHTVMVACAYHMVEHKDASRMTNLYNGLSNAVNKKNGINLWIRRYTTLILRKDAAGVYKFLGKEKEYSFDTAGELTPFYDMPEVDKLNKPFELSKMFESLVNRAEKNADEIKSDRDKSLFKALEDVAKAFLIESKVKPVTKPKKTPPIMSSDALGLAA